MYRNTIVVFGATGSIGSAITKSLLKTDHRVVSVGHWEEYSFGNDNAKLDALSREHIDKLFTDVGLVHTIVVSLGRYGRAQFLTEATTPMHEISSLLMRKEFDIHVVANQNILQAAIEHAKKPIRGIDLVILGSGVTQVVGSPMRPDWFNPGAYFLANLAKEAWVSELNKQKLKAKGVSVHLFRFGAVETPFHDDTPDNFRPPSTLSLEKAGELVSAAVISRKYPEEVVR